VANKKDLTNHKRETCRCAGCVSRRREAEAVLARARGDVLTEEEIKQQKERDRMKKRNALEPIDADLPPEFFTKRRSMRDHIADYVEVRLTEPSLKHAEIAKRIGMTPQALSTLIYRATKQGILKFEDPIERINNQIIPKTMDNLNEFLDLKDKTVTLETAKGVIFPIYQKAQGVGENNNTMLALKIEMVSPEDIKIIQGQVVGKPRQLIEGELEE
jgi:hypothetical protein